MGISRKKEHMAQLIDIKHVLLQKDLNKGMV
jgi:hypothetical protein